MAKQKKSAFAGRKFRCGVCRRSFDTPGAVRGHHFRNPTHASSKAVKVLPTKPREGTTAAGEKPQRYCTSCGLQLGKDWRYCGGCGAVLKQRAA